MLNRKSAPAIHDITRLILPRPQQITLDNGIPLYVLDYPGQEIVKIEVVYKAGRPEENKRLTSRATARLVREGSGKHFDPDCVQAFLGAWEDVLAIRSRYTEHT